MIKGKLTWAGTRERDGHEEIGVFVTMTEEALRSVNRLPMYQTVTVEEFGLTEVAPPEGLVQSLDSLNHENVELRKALRDVHAEADNAARVFEARIARLEEQHRMEMAAVMTATVQNTESSKADRIGRDNPYWTLAYDDVCRSVDREITLRNHRDNLQERLDETRAENVKLNDLIANRADRLEPTHGDFERENLRKEVKDLRTIYNREVAINATLQLKCDEFRKRADQAYAPIEPQNWSVAEREKNQRVIISDLQARLVSIMNFASKPPDLHAPDLTTAWNRLSHIATMAREALGT